MKKKRATLNRNHRQELAALEERDRIIASAELNRQRDALEQAQREADAMEYLRPVTDAVRPVWRTA